MGRPAHLYPFEYRYNLDIPNLYYPSGLSSPVVSCNKRGAYGMKNRIKVYRALRNLTQEVLADQLGVTRQTILAIEKGKYDPSLELAFRISRLFKVPLEKMFFYDTDGEDQPLFED
jgi:putative transcriptional regulator